MTRARGAAELRRDLPATLDALEAFLADFARFALDHDLPQRFESELVLREVLTNAIVHGSRCDSQLKVRCIVRLRNGRLTIAISDQGPGFDWRGQLHHVPHEVDCSGRGVGIICGLCQAVRFNRAGSAVVMVRHLPVKPSPLFPDSSVCP